MLAFRPGNPKRDQNLQLTPLSETTSIPVTFIWEPPPPGNDPETANDPRPQMIPKLDRKLSPGWASNDPAKKFEMVWSFSEGENTGR